jgi:transposase
MRFNEQGLAALSVAAGRGRKCTCTSEERSLILQEVQRPPDREEDGTATWSLKMLERALRKKGLPQLGARTIREVLHEAGYSFQQTRTWCRTGYALRKRKSGTVLVYDLETRGAKKTN